MTPHEAIRRIGQSTAQAGFTVSDEMLMGSPVLVARTAQFRLRWLATRLHTFLVAGAFPPGTATRDQLDGFLRAALHYAKANKGGLPVGFQTGVAVVTVAVTEQAPPAALEWAGSPHGREFGALPFPAVADIATGQVTRPPRMLFGGVYSSHLKSTVDTHVAGALGARVMA